MLFYLIFLLIVKSKWEEEWAQQLDAYRIEWHLLFLFWDFQLVPLKSLAKYWR